MQLLLRLRLTLRSMLEPHAGIHNGPQNMVERSSRTAEGGACDQRQGLARDPTKSQQTAGRATGGLQ